MAKRQDKKWQPTSLERVQQAERDKKMGIFRKKKQVPKLQIAKGAQKAITEIAEFEFDKGFQMPDFAPQPGQIVQMRTPRGYGKSYWEQEVFKYGRRGEEMPYNQFSRVDNAKVNFIVNIIDQKYRVMIEVFSGNGDYVEFRTRGVEPERRVKIARTMISIAEPDGIIRMVEEGLGLVKVKEEPNLIEKTKTEGEQWAEKWAKEQK